MPISSIPTPDPSSPHYSPPLHKKTLSSTSSTSPLEEALVVFIKGKWVNLEAWKKVHPGGSSTLERFRGQDATDAFHSLHSKEANSILDRMKNIENSLPPAISQGLLKPTKVATSFREFRSQLESEGWFERNWIWDFFYIALIFSMALVGTLISYQHPYIATLIIGIGMQQAGWIGHDYVHGRGKISYILGFLIGGAYNGFSARWWSDKHNKHHVHTNQLGIDEDIQNDPILHLWIPQPEKDHSLRPYQHFYYHVVYAFLYVSWRIQSIQWSISKSDKLELLLIGINYLWLLYLPLQVSIGSVIIGGFLVAEIVTATHQSEDIISGVSYTFVEDQFRTTRDVDIDSTFMNYLWGGMQFQLEHHLFPTMPKYRYQSLKSRVKEFAKENGLEYRTSPLSEILTMNYETMRRFASTKS